MVKVSVIITCKKGTDLTAMFKALNNQTFKDFEVIVTHDKTIPEGWNSGIERAIGEIFVLTESDCIPTRTWLEELVSEIEDGILVRGLEVVEAPICPANIAITRKTLGDERFNKDFYPADDSEFLIRLSSKGVDIKELDKAIVYHKRRKNIRKRFYWSFLYGARWMRIYQRYGKVHKSYLHAMGGYLAGIVENILGLISSIFGIIWYLPERRYRSKVKRCQDLVVHKDKL